MKFWLTCDIFSDQVDALEGAIRVFGLAIEEPELKCKFAFKVACVMHNGHEYWTWKVDLNLFNLWQFELYAYYILVLLSWGNEHFSIGREGNEFDFENISQPCIDSKVDLMVTVGRLLVQCIHTYSILLRVSLRCHFSCAAWLSLRARKILQKALTSWIVAVLNTSFFNCGDILRATVTL